MWRLVGRVRSKTTVSTSQGRLSVYTRDTVIGYHLYTNGQYEWDLSKEVTSWLARHSNWRAGTGTILDVGANMGVISIGMVRNGLFKRAIAIEPEPRNFALLKENVEQNNMAEAILCLPFAVADKPGQIKFELSEVNFGDHRVHSEAPASGGDHLAAEAPREVIPVEADSLDNLLRDRVLPETANQIALIWIDVQGYEGVAFRGGKQLLSRGIPVVAEIWPDGLNRAGMSDDEFCELTGSFWSSYWVFRRGRFVRYPISSLQSLMDEVGHGEMFENVIFTK